MQPTQAVLAALRRAAREVILPRFRQLGADDIAAKSRFDDLVTIADTEAEAMIRADLAQSWPEAVVMGEEAISQGVQRRADVAGPGWRVIVDPVDGTWNFAKGLAAFGMIAAIAQDGVLRHGLLYDPLLDDWVEAGQGLPARLTRADGRSQALRTSGEQDPSRMMGYVPLPLYPAALRPAVAEASLAFRRTGWLVCSCHEYRLLAQGHVDFVLSGPRPMPWDHAAAVLITRAAGGVARFLDGADYALARETGVLLVASSEEVWQQVASTYAVLGQDFG